MHIQYRSPTAAQKKIPPKETPSFGSVFSQHMFIQEWTLGQGWHDAQIQAYQPLNLEPAATIFHYGQEFFEGMKAYHRKDGGINLFRPLDNFKRFNNSAERLSMPTVDIQDHLEALKQLVLKDKDWIPQTLGASLYIRPTMIATEPFLGVHASKNYLHFIITSPVGNYYAKGLNPIAVLVTQNYRRGVKGGTAHVKAGGNYGASIIASETAKEQGYDQVLWLDAINGKNVEEAGTSNIFFVYKDKTIKTPQLSGSILPGITRDSILKLAPTLGLPVEETTLTIDQVVTDIEAGKITEVFATGTAAVISPIGTIGHNQKDYVVNNNEIGSVTQLLYDELTGIQYGTKKDPFGWVVSAE